MKNRHEPLTDQEKLLRRLGRLVGALVVLLVAVAVIVVALELQVQTRNTRLARLDVAVQETKQASHRALVASNGSKKALDDALAQVRSSSGSGPSGADIAAALRTIATIEQQLQTLIDRR